MNRLAECDALRVRNKLQLRKGFDSGAVGEVIVMHPPLGMENERTQDPRGTEDYRLLKRLLARLVLRHFHPSAILRQLSLLLIFR